MSYRIDPSDNSLVIEGWQAGISPDPYSGPTNLQNVNIASIAGEASVGFSTTGVVTAPSYGPITITSTGDGATVSATNSQIPQLEDGQAVYFTASTISGLATTGTAVYWVTSIDHSGSLPNCTFGLSQFYRNTTGNTFGTSGTATMYTFNLSLGKGGRGNMYKNYMVKSQALLNNTDVFWLLDSNGLVWSNLVLTAGGTGLGATNSWTYTGNQGNAGPVPTTTANGNGFAYMPTANSSGGVMSLDGWLFVWRNGQIDYLKIESLGSLIASDSLSWVYGWKPSAGTVGQSNYLTNNNGVYPYHEAVVTPDGRTCYCDGYIIGRFYQADASTPVAFNPQSTSTYVFNTYPILPVDDTAQCMSYLGSNLLIGGQKNRIYPWDLVSNQYTNPLIQLPENDVRTIVTVNLQAYIFCGGRGNIYITNGSQAELWHKVPDYLGGKPQPTFYWGGATYNQNILYFGVFGITNGGTISPTLSYGGIWGIYLPTKAMFVSNILSGGSVAYPSAMLSVLGDVGGNTFNGYGIYAAWGGGTSPTSGVDAPSKNLYSDGSSIVETEYIPIGSFNKPKNFNQIEYKLVKPLVSGESIQLFYRTDPSTSYTSMFTDSTAGNLSNTKPTNFKNVQWVQFKAVLTSTQVSPSYVRLKEIRLFN